MDEKTMDSIIKILLIISIILCVLSIILPWGQISVGLMGNVDFYSWGISGNSIFGGSESNTELYVTLFFNEEFMTLLSENENFIGFVIPMVFGILIFPFLIIGIIFGSIYVLFEGKRNIINIRDSGLWVVVSVIFYYIFIQFGMISLIEDISSISISSFFSYALGYFIVILSAIILISIYIINKEFLDTSMGKKESKGKQDDLLKLLKERYIKGEISKEEFDQMKKDIE